MPYRSKILCALLAFSLISCTQQTIVPCEPTVRIGTAEITYFYSLNNSQSNLYQSSVDQLTLYIFDSNGYFHSKQVVDNRDLIKNDFPVTIHLPVGKYTIVTFGGDVNHYELHTVTDAASNSYVNQITPLQTHIEQFRLAAKISDGTIQPVGEIYGTTTQTEISVEYPTINKYVVELIQNTHWLTIDVAGIDNLPSKALSPLSITIKGNNTRFAKNNSIDHSWGTFSYSLAPESYENNQVSTKNRILRIDATSKVSIDITHTATGRKIASLDLLEALMATAQFKNQRDLDRPDGYNIRLTIDGQQVVTLKVNGWDVINVGVM